MPVVTFVFAERYGYLVFRVCFRSPGVTSSSLTDTFGFGFGDFEQSTQRILLSHVLEKVRIGHYRLFFSDNLTSKFRSELEGPPTCSHALWIRDNESH